ncbi:ribonucleoside-diphosphate reductase, adenosylcobalamin-dependent (plasmid) [Oceanithermus profundus DSM 14977]|uniref:Vitamin B12-dependent ribonucleotide reductase n=1 Tax=Oceanithermus profundus (strain DSM 14977 / NBRC 100410 / VKM B-2274 / 506) TaxID=670487 RepID=E4UAT0_OCEP5|nr:adenosylcobalamin-dependent ribonucleoside-diphosphate reductase [Oceanithermus profundus]ADR37715.1 ribonucleoside-diphosphate reductase, adenosylcobalamin-dependent [Oceanithermus profundus DSM 14977]
MPTPFDEHAQAIVRRQYAQPGEDSVEDVLRRVAREIARPEGPEREVWEERFYELMAEKRFLPGGRILAGAGTGHGNLLNCHVQGALEHPEGSLEGVMEIARKLALVTKVGGGNGVNLDALPPARRGVQVIFPDPVAFMRADHPDVRSFIRGDYPPTDPARPDRGVFAGRIFLRAVYGELSDELRALAREQGVIVREALPQGAIEVPDDMGGIIDAATEAVRRALAGEQVYVDFSALRPEGAPVKRSGGTASGPVSFLSEIFDHFLYWARLGGVESGPVATLRYVYAPILRVVRQGGTRRGAGMATLSWQHPDVLDFLTAKDLDREEAEGDIATFNISVLADNELFDGPAVDSGYLHPVPGKYDSLPTLSDVRPWILEQIAEHAWATGEPGLIFIDRINEKSPLKVLDERWRITATNPCGEIPLAKGEACDLGAMILPSYVKDGAFDEAAFRRDVRLAVRFLDNVLDVTRYAVKDNEETQALTRRLGLGVMGLADMLILMGYRYDDPEAREVVEHVVGILRDEALAESERLAEERGVFPLYAQHQKEFEALGIRPRRNLALLTVAPTGTVSMVAGVSSGIEPIFAAFVWRRIGEQYVPLVHPLFARLLEGFEPPEGYRTPEGRWNMESVLAALQEHHGSPQQLDFLPQAIRDVFVTAHDVAPEDHVAMQAAVQRAFDASEQLVGNAISKTTNLPNEATVEDVLTVYRTAWKLGAKGITVYRDGSRDLQVLATSKQDDDAPKEPELPAEEPTVPVYERPSRLIGHTDMVKLTNGDGRPHSYLVTVNYFEGNPIEVIITTGKAGDETNADSEALGRVVSIALQYGVPPEAIIKTLRGINGGLYGSYAKRFVTSKADLIAVALELATKERAKEPAAEPKKTVAPEPAPAPAVVLAGGAAAESGHACPECGEPMVRSEGCWTCHACGYSKCG